MNYIQSSVEGTTEKRQGKTSRFKFVIKFSYLVSLLDVRQTFKSALVNSKMRHRMK